MGSHNHVPVDEDDDESDEEICVPIKPGGKFLFGDNVWWFIWIII